MFRLILPAVALSFGCAYTDSGGGTKTLEVIAELEYDAESNETRVEISVEKEGLVVDGAKVELTDGETNETFTIEQFQPGQEYTDDLDAYHRRMEIEVKVGSTDHLQGRLEGPGAHWVVEPQNDKPVSRSSIGDELEVKWETEDGIAAREVVVEVDHEFSHTIRDYEDPGEYAVPAVEFDDGDTRVRVVRTNEVRLAGGSGASKLQVSYEAGNEFPIE